jgi:hypothetical protein
MTKEQIIGDAEIAATYFLELMKKGVPMEAAIQLTGSHTIACRVSAAQHEKPKEPWEPE